MKERGLILAGHEVRAVLAGTKTQHRLPIGLREFQSSKTPGYDFTFRDRRALWNDFATADLIASKFAPWKVGDVAWVRETFCIVNDLPDPDPYVVLYFADHVRRPISHEHQEDASLIDYDFGEQTRSSSQMPRWASRLSLRITDVRIQRVQSVTEQEAAAEGITSQSMAGSKATIVSPDGAETETTFAWTSCSYAFATRWANRHGSDSWTRNDWTWALTWEVMT